MPFIDVSDVQYLGTANLENDPQARGFIGSKKGARTTIYVVIFCINLRLSKIGSQVRLCYVERR